MGFQMPVTLLSESVVVTHARPSWPASEFRGTGGPPESRAAVPGRGLGARPGGPKCLVSGLVASTATDSEAIRLIETRDTTANREFPCGSPGHLELDCLPVSEDGQLEARAAASRVTSRGRGGRGRRWRWSSRRPATPLDSGGPPGPSVCSQWDLCVLWRLFVRLSSVRVLRRSLSDCLAGCQPQSESGTGLRHIESLHRIASLTKNQHFSPSATESHMYPILRIPSNTLLCIMQIGVQWGHNLYADSISSLLEEILS